MAGVSQMDRMRTVLFTIFVILFAIVTLVTILSLCKIIDIDEKYKSALVPVFILEVGGAVVALFYMLFGIKKKNAFADTLRIQISSIENEFDRAKTYSITYELFNQHTGEKKICANVANQWGFDGSLGFIVKEITEDVYISFVIKDGNKTWVSDHFMPGTMRFQKLNLLP